MTDREKLIELLVDADDLPSCADYEGFADYLIANGVTVQKHGRWEYEDFVSPTLHCSVCKGLAGMDCCGDYHSEKSNYCPNCGADMRGGSDG